MNKRFAGITVILLVFATVIFGHTDPSKPFYPNDIKVVGGSKLLMANAGTREVVLYDLSGQILQKWSFNEPVTGIAVDQNRVFITSSDTRGFMTILDMNHPGKFMARKVGMGARSPVLSKDNKYLYLAEQFENSIIKIDTKTGKTMGKVAVLREPVDLAISLDGRYLFVNNFLPAQRADIGIVAADVSVIDLIRFVKVNDIKLSSGSNALRGICLSPDGEYMFVTHNLGRYQVPTSQLEQGWMNTSGLSIIDVLNRTLIATVILDEPEYGAAGSWDIHCTTDKMVVTHSGTHDISVIDYHAFKEKLRSEPDKGGLSYNLNFLTDIRRRYPIIGNGPRTFALNGNTAYIPTYFSDTLNIFDLTTGNSEALALNPDRTENRADKGKRIFNDATRCFQGWQSCNGCRPGDARTDALNWDLLNDGMGNPKNCKSLLFAHQTPPAMISGIRGSAEVAVRAGFTHIQFSEISEEDASYVDDYLKSLEPLQSPWLIHGGLSPAARKGKRIFNREGCADCHHGPWYTDLKSHNIGEEEKIFTDWEGWDTPTLREVWRTAPYLFNGSVYEMKEVFAVKKHGLKKELTQKEVDQLTEYVNSL